MYCVTTLLSSSAPSLRRRWLCLAPTTKRVYQKIYRMSSAQQSTPAAAAEAAKKNPRGIESDTWSQLLQSEVSTRVLSVVASAAEPRKEDLYFTHSATTTTTRRQWRAECCGYSRWQ